MSLRRKSRECALQMLFQLGMNHQSPGRIESSFWKSTRGAQATRKFANELFEGTVAQAEASDALIGKLSKNWRIERMSEIDRGILRLAIYELRSGTAPVKVVINEAIELAKKFSTPESTPFLNGILDSASKFLDKQ
ncbi:MAG TPA: transcription antitermination factor NusB [Candidatus Acidoferrales bacterium]|nr:transcription antitermination factor NusB [Candidatus Acidoferrales bacterium]HEV2340481.1 transcription antitermination factor NusB [Candidatus Acidoferrales bacterium]